MKTKIFFLVYMLLTVISVKAQQDSVPAADNRPVRNPYSCNLLVDNQTAITITKGSFEMMIQHRFGEIKSVNDLFGIYAPSNIRMGFNYGVTDRLTVSIGTEKNNKLQDLGWKYSILRQTRSGSMPIFLTYHGNIGIDVRKDETFGSEYKFTNRLSYFNQIIVARKFNDRITAQLAGSFTHFNSVPGYLSENPSPETRAEALWRHDQIGLMVGGRVKIKNEMSVLLDYSQSFSTLAYHDFQQKPQPNLSLGWEKATSTHSFQLFIANYDKINPQSNFAFNERKLADGKFIIGFNVTVRFN